MKLDLRQMRLVLALDRHRNFARAAEALGLSQPALSKGLRVLEEALGARIFDRDRARVEPTTVGVALISRSRPLLEAARDVERELSELIHLSGGLLRVGAGPIAAESSVAPALGRLVTEHPGIAVDLSVNDWTELVRRVLAGELDLAVAEISLAVAEPRLHIEPLPRHKGVFYCRSGHPLTRKKTPTLDDVRRYALVMSSLPERLLRLVDPKRPPAQLPLPEGTVAPDIRVSALGAGRQIVEHSNAVGIALPFQIEPYVRLGRLVALPTRLPWLTTAYGIVQLANRTPSPAADEFISILREVEADLAAGVGLASAR